MIGTETQYIALKSLRETREKALQELRAEENAMRWKLIEEQGLENYVFFDWVGMEYMEYTSLEFVGEMPLRVLRSEQRFLRRLAQWLIWSLMDDIQADTFREVFPDFEGGYLQLVREMEKSLLLNTKDKLSINEEFRNQTSASVKHIIGKEFSD